MNKPGVTTRILKAKKNSSLSEEEKKFANNYITYGNASKAYQFAFPEKSAKFDANKCSIYGNNILKKRHIRDYIDLRNKSAKEILSSIAKDVALDEEQNLDLRLKSAKLNFDASKEDSLVSAAKKFWTISASVNAQAVKPIPKSEFYKLVKRDKV